jgi:hypothetical protein
MTTMEPSDIERTSLDAHVSICAIRYEQLDNRLTIIETKVIDLSKAIEDSKNSMTKVIIGATGSIVASLVGVIVTILMKF